MHPKCYSAIQVDQGLIQILLKWLLIGDGNKYIDPQPGIMLKKRYNLKFQSDTSSQGSGTLMEKDVKRF